MKTKRNPSIDIMKSILVILMTMSHLTYYTSMHIHYNVEEFNAYVDLTTFSGFIFCFGFASWYAYVNSERNYKTISIRLLKGFFKSLFAYFISGAFENFMLLKHGLNDFFKILTFKTLPGLSEFLLSFALLYLLLLILVPILRHLDIIGLISFFLLTLIPAFLPAPNVSNPILASLIGSNHGYVFPVLLYLPHFFFGMILARNNIKFNPWVLIISIFCTAFFYNDLYYHNSIPNRFPPSLAWIIGSAGFIYIYFLFSCLLSRILENNTIILPVLTYPGKHTLLILVTGNLMVYLFYDLRKYLGPDIIHGFKRETFVYLLALFSTLAISLMTSLLKKLIICHFFK